MVRWSYEKAYGWLDREVFQLRGTLHQSFSFSCLKNGETMLPKTMRLCGDILIHLGWFGMTLDFFSHYISYS